MIDLLCYHFLACQVIAFIVMFFSMKCQNFDLCATGVMNWEVPNVMPLVYWSFLMAVPLPPAVDSDVDDAIRTGGLHVLAASSCLAPGSLQFGRCPNANADSPSQVGVNGGRHGGRYVANDNIIIIDVVLVGHI